MTDDLALDPATVAEQTDDVRYRPADPWLRRRALRMGASDVPALLLAYDLRGDEARDARAYHHAAAASTRTRRGTLPMVIARKAGLRRPEASTPTMRRGTAREPALLRRWAALTPDIARHSLVVAASMPPWARHAIDHECPALAATLDGYALDALGEVVVLEAKCPRVSYDDAPWYWIVQVQAQLAVTRCDAGVIVCGPGWGSSDDGGGDPVAWWVERDETSIARIRDVCRLAAADLARAMEETT